MILRLAALSIVLATASCTAAGARGENLPPVVADSLIRADSAKKTFHLVDVRTPGEFATGHIAGATLIDFHGPDFQEKISKLPRQEKILLVCRSGNRSGQALGILKGMGFSDIQHVAGGMNAWRSQSLPVAP
ncbi:MAG: rhodanese-like domain-containing protein [Fibrobacterota bacterium]|nr:rhodanese-like domain-containing protein [Fibrobacterota bacterium]QQS04663.1 MAG: rhodanese-like domain-containing protein [Fibrobacterota bacterium]